MNAIEQALKVAVMAHEGQKDLDGLPVILHPITVGFAGETEDEIVVGILHDTIEDTEVDATFLEAAGFAPHIVEAVELLTHTEDMTYEEYLHRLKHSGNNLAMKVKLHDLQHNLKRGRIGGHTQQVTKHEKAYAYLTAQE